MFSIGFGSLTDAKRLRTFFPITRTGRTYLGCYDWQFKISIRDLFSMFKFLRVLSLFKCSDLREVPDSLGDLKHLNSLDLSRTNIQKLPDSTCSLYNLQILKLNYCYNLEELPVNLRKLIKLRCLEFTRSKVAKMPMHLGELKNLQVLSTFFVDKNNEFSAKQLGGLDLHGDLSIKELQNIISSSDALAMELKIKTHLVTLKLKWNKNHIPDDPRKEKEVLQNLQPSKHLELLSISNYGGTQFPSWVFDNSLSNLVFLRLEDCKYCLCLPPLGILSCLKILQIIGLDGIVSIGAEFYGSSSSPFPSLERLYFHEMKELEDWECITASFPRLQDLSMSQCPKLKGLAEQLFHLKKLSIHYCDRLIVSGHKMETSSLEVLRISSYPMRKIPMTSYDLIEEMEIDDCSEFLTIFPLDFFPKLRLLRLTNCQNLQIITQEHTHNYLKELTIDECPQFESFPSEGLSAPLLVILSISALKNLKLLPKCMRILLPSLTRLSVNDCPQVEMFPDGGLPSNVKYVTLSSFKLIASLKDTMDINTCLESLCIEKVNVESFPEEGLLPRSLSLRIYDCPNLKKLDYSGLFHLSSLTLHKCPNLKCLPEEGLPRSISNLEIWGCPLLKQRCQKPQGEDWEKIANIQYVNIFE